MPAQRDFETLYSPDPGKIRANANLPGELVLPLNRLTVHAVNLEKYRGAIEKATPGYDADHLHVAACKVQLTVFGIEATCQKWNWKDWGIPEDYNPVREFILPYLQLSRSEAMKGSEQVVRSMQGSVAGNEIDGGGVEPDLSPRGGPGHPGRPGAVSVVVNNGVQGVRDAKKEVSMAKRMVGLGGKT